MIRAMLVVLLPKFWVDGAFVSKDLEVAAAKSIFWRGLLPRCVVNTWRITKFSLGDYEFWSNRRREGNKIYTHL